MQASLNPLFLNRLIHVECPNATYRPEHTPLVFEKAHGSLIWDVDGREYVDLCAGFGALALGHADASLLETFQDYACGLTGTEPPIIHAMGDVYPSRAKIELLEDLRAALPTHLTKGMLALSGSQAVEIAIKTALLATKRKHVIAFEGGYHGVDMGPLPLVSRADFRTPFAAWLPENCIIRLPYGCPENLIENALAENNVAALIAEPIQGRAGARLPPKGWLQMLRRMTSLHGSLLVFDEIFTGLGRCGKTLVTEDIESDLVCLGKALGGGFPTSVTFGTEDVMRAWPECQAESIHTGTFFGHAFSCDIATKTLRAIRERDLIKRSQSLGQRTLEKMRQRWSSQPAVREIRGQGLMIAIEFHTPGLGAVFMNDLRTKGVIALASGETGECLALTPALNISEDLLDKALNVIDCLF